MVRPQCYKPVLVFIRVLLALDRSAEVVDPRLPDKGLIHAAACFLVRWMTVALHGVQILVCHPTSMSVDPSLGEDFLLGQSIVYKSQSK